MRSDFSLNSSMLWFWCTHMAISISVQYDDGSLPDIMYVCRYGHHIAIVAGYGSTG